MKILLILPPFSRLHGLKIEYFPLGLGYLAAYVEKKGFDVKMYNAEMGKEPRIASSYSVYKKAFRDYINRMEDPNDFIWQEVKSVLRNVAPMVVGLSVMTAKSGSAKKISQIVKEFNPRSIVVWGGPHPTILPDEVLQDTNVDFAVRGEGEQTFLELCQALKKGSNIFSEIKGLSYKKDNKIFHNTDRELITDLDSLPFPGKHLDLKKELYTPGQMAVIVTSRGCPFNCGYCGAKSIWNRRLRHRTAENVLKEIDQIVERYNVKSFFFWDDCFTSSRKTTLDLCQKIIQRKRKFEFSITTRVNLVDYELLNVMKQAGLLSIDFGIETGSPRILKLIHKEVNQQQILKAVKLCKKLHILVNAFIMVGFPEETEEDIKMTLRFIKKIKPHTVYLSIYTPYPGTELYDKAKELGLVSEPVNWQYFSHQSPENHFVKHISKERFSEVVAELAKNFDRLNHLNKWERRVKLFIRNPILTSNKVLSRIQSK